MGTSLYPVALTNKDIAVGDNTNREETVEEADKEHVANTEGTKVNRANILGNTTVNQNTRNIRQTDDAVNFNQFVYEGRCRYFPDHPKDWNVDRQDDSNCQHPKPVQQLLSHRVWKTLQKNNIEFTIYGTIFIE